MGTWGDGIWDNDEAADWAFGFERANYDDGVAILEDALETAPINGSLNEDGRPVFAAAVYVLALLVGWEPASRISCGADAHTWALAHRDQAAGTDLPARAANTVERLLRSLLHDEGAIDALRGDFDEIWEGDVELPQWATDLNVIREVLLDR